MLRPPAAQASGYGPLKAGFVFSVSTALARQLLGRPPPPVLCALGRTLQFEVAVGVNGRVSEPPSVLSRRRALRPLLCGPSASQHSCGPAPWQSVQSGRALAGELSPGARGRARPWRTPPAYPTSPFNPCPRP